MANYFVCGLCSEISYETTFPNRYRFFSAVGRKNQSGRLMLFCTVNASRAVTDKPLIATITNGVITGKGEGKPTVTDKPLIATVTNGVITGKGEGTATITATATDGSNVSGSCIVTVTPATAMLTILYRSGSSGDLHTHGDIPQQHQVKTPGYFELKQPGNMMRAGHLFGGWSDPVGYVRQPGQHYANTAQPGTWIQTAVWNPIPNPLPSNPTIAGAPQGPYTTANAAATAWANYVYSTSLYVRYEFYAGIYEPTPGIFRLTRTASGTPHSGAGLNIILDEIPANQRVAYIHTHPNTHGFTEPDLDYGVSYGIDAYVAAPTAYMGTSDFHLVWFDHINHSIVADTIPLGPVTLRSLSTTERTNLASIYLNSWIDHLTPQHGNSFGCSDRQWPTYPWPPA